MAVAVTIADHHASVDANDLVALGDFDLVQAGFLEQFGQLFNGFGINEENGLLLNGSHTHYAHWKSATAFELYALAPGPHTVRLVLADQNHSELPNPEAQKNLVFTIVASPTGELLLQKVTPGLTVPVAMAVVPDGRMFVNEQLSGRVRVVNTATWQLQADFCNVSVSAIGEMGLLGIAIDPDFSSNHYVYLYYTVDSPYRNRVVRYTDTSGVCTNPTIIVDNIPASGIHNGGIIHFGPDRNLYIMTGDAAQASLAQDLTYLGGKMLRVKADGTAAVGNPFIGNPSFPGADPRIYSFGHRNSFGFTFHPSTGHLWQTENGPDKNDEVNRIVAGGNYGWPTVQGIANNPLFIDPIVAFTPPFAPTNIVVVNSPHYPTSFQGNLIFGDFVQGKLRRLILDATLTHLGATPIESFTGNGEPIIGLVNGPDGFLYASSTTSIYRVVPQ